MNKRSNKPRIGISIGDINGVGIELFLKSVCKKGFLDFYTPVLFGSTRLCTYYKNILNLEVKLQGIRGPEDIIDRAANVVNLWKEEIKINPGEPTEEAGKYALLSLQAAVRALKLGQVNGLVTAPLNKNLIYSKEFPFLGHTKYLQETLEGEALMLMVHEDIKVALVTEHLPLEEVSRKITASRIARKLKALINSLERDFTIQRPKIAVLGLNPHAGDGGIIGKQEEREIKPVIEEFFQKGFLVFGPYSADGFFGSGNYRQFDGILAMYHDQGLIPFKTLAFHEGVNFTAGLSHVRTSPDHGVAYDKAAKGIADETSFQKAIFTCIEIIKNRNS